MKAIKQTVTDNEAFQRSHWQKNKKIQGCNWPSKRILSQPRIRHYDLIRALFRLLR